MRKTFDKEIVARNFLYNSLGFTHR